MLLVETKLGFDELLRALLEYPPSTLARVVPIIACVSYGSTPEELADTIYDVVKNFAGRLGKVRLGRHGRLSASEWETVLNMLSAKLGISGGGQLTLLIEPLRSSVCVGIVPDDKDKFFLKTVRKLQPHRRPP